MWALVLVLAVELPGTQPGGLEQPLQEPSVCHDCHTGYSEAAAGDTWGGSMMANAARDPLFLAALTIANQDVPGVGDLCIRCHTPRGWLAGRADPPDGSALIDSDLEGVDCDFCHRLVEGEGPLIGNGQFFVADDFVRRGPFADSRSRHEAEQSAYLPTSEMCGVCHDVSNPLLVGFPIERTYTEWKRSAFAEEGKSCQSCHMPTEQDVAADTDNLPERQIHRHDLVGGNTWMPGVLATLYPDKAEAYAYTTARALEMLRQSAELEIVAEPAQAGGGFAFTVRVENRTGHKLPTGYPEGRRCWLEVELRDAGGTLLLHSGAYDDAEAERVEDAQLRTYEVELAAGGVPGFHFALQDERVQDNRIPPRGFRPDEDTQPVGREYPELPDGTLAHWDEAPYSVELPADTRGPLQVTARLRYQSTSRAYVEFLRDENRTDDRGQTMHALWSANGRAAPVGIAAAQLSVPVTPQPDAALDAGLADAGSDAAVDALEDAAPIPLGEPAPVPGGTPTGADGGGCSTAPRGGPWWLGILLLGALRRRAK